MNIKSLHIIETALKVKLPDRYKEIVLDHPFKNAVIFQSVKNSLLNNAEAIIDLNIRYRTKGVQGKSWPNNYFIMGYNVDDDYIYFLDLNFIQNETVFSLSCEDDKFNPKNIKKLKLKSNIDEFVDDQIFLQELDDNP
jgi:hypothetical protein